MTRTAEETIRTLEFTKEQEIAAPIEVVFETLLEHLGPLHETSPESPLPMTLEPWPGGRWYRDLGNDSGHLWGFVQSIKPPTLLEIWGPMMISNPVATHMIMRLTPTGSGTSLLFKNEVFGPLPEEHRDHMKDGMEEGWKSFVEGLKRDLER